MSKAGVLAFRYLFQVGDWARLRKLEQDTSDLALVLDIPYLDDGDRGHLLDVYKAKDAKPGNPVVINIHGGGLFASFKDLNANFNYEFARRGFDVVSLSYIRLPDTTFWHQIDDCMNALRYVATHADELGLDLTNVYLTGDSAGALLAYCCCAIENSEELQKSFDIAPAGLNIGGLGLVSIMLDTTRHDLMAAITDQIAKGDDFDRDCIAYLQDPASMLDVTTLPPVYQVTGIQDLIQKDSLKFEQLLSEKGVKHELKDYPKGKERKLDHVFSVKFPKWPESQEVIDNICGWFRQSAGSAPVCDGKYHKYFVWSFDDGLEQDKRIIETLKKYGMGATFNLNSGLFGLKQYTPRIANLGFADIDAEEYEAKKHHFFPAAEHFRIPADEVVEVFQGFEVASHTVNHPRLARLKKDEIRKEIEEDIKALSELFGQDVVGFAAPFGSMNKDVMDVLNECGVKYNRAVSTDDSFRFPEDPLNMPLSNWCISGKTFDRLEAFFEAEPVDDDLLFVCFAHGYEFDFGTKESSWEKFEKICETVAAHKDIICCSTRDAFEAHEATKAAKK